MQGLKRLNNQMEHLRCLLTQQGGYMNQQGFSLIEIMVVIAIISILSAIAIPGYQGYMQKRQ